MRDERIEGLEKEGLIQPAKKKKVKNLPPPLPLPGELARKLLEEDRNHCNTIIKALARMEAE